MIARARRAEVFISSATLPQTSGAKSPIRKVPANLGFAGALRADEGTRTPDPLLTMEVLYQLSYVGVYVDGGSRIRTCVG